MRRVKGLTVGMILAIPAVMIMMGCGGDGEVKERPQRAVDIKVPEPLSSAMNTFGFELCRQLYKPSENVFLSPVSLQLALGMAYNGARGSTKDAMAKALGYGDMSLDDVNAANAELIKLLSNPDPKIDLYIANALWGRQGVTYDAGFVRRCQDYFLAESFTLDFAAADAADRVNAWVKQKTRDRIPTIVTPDAIKEAILLLTNAIYFKAGWTEAFPPAATKDANFTNGDGTQTTVPMMHRSASFEYVETDVLQMVRLPYQAGHVAMYVMLPKPDTELGSLLEKLDAGEWQKWLGQMTNRPGKVGLPRFKTEFSASLKPALAARGMAVAFEPAQADLNGILPPDSTPERVFISDVLHKTYLSVDEQGTEAAAATAVVMGITSVPANPFEMIVNRPFLVVIADKPTGVILFVGAITKL